MMIRKVTFYWVLLTLALVNSWLLSKPNIIGKIGLLIYKYHYLRSFPRTLLTVWIVVSTSVLIVLVIQYLNKHGRMGKGLATVLFSACILLSVLLFTKVAMDFTSWSYSLTGLKFRIGAHMLPLILVFVFTNGLIALFAQVRAQKVTDSVTVESIQQEIQGEISPDTSLPLRP
jgi:hypothetical protein